VVTGWLSQLEAAGRSVATRRRKLAAVLSFTAPPPARQHQLRRSRRRPGERTKAGEHPEGRRDDADTGGIETQQARALWQSTAGRPRTRALVSIMLFCGFRVSQDIGLHMANVAYAEVDTTGWPIPEAAADVLAAVGR